MLERPFKFEISTDNGRFSQVMSSTLNGRSSLSESLSSLFEHVLPDNGVIACGCVRMQDQDIRLLVKLDSLICVRDDVRMLLGERASARDFSLTVSNPLPSPLQLPPSRQGPPRLSSEGHSGERGYSRNARSATIPEPGARKKDKYRRTSLLQRQYQASGLTRLLPRVSCS